MMTYTIRPTGTAIPVSSTRLPLGAQISSASCNHPPDDGPPVTGRNGRPASPVVGDHTTPSTDYRRNDL